MKNITIKTLCSVFGLLAMVACESMRDTDTRLAPVTNLIEPVDGNTVVLETS